MKSRRTQRFKQQFRALSPDVQHKAVTAYRLFKRDPFHPSLHFKSVSPDQVIFSVRVGIHHRALGRREDTDLIVWFWIGTHAEYDKLLNR